MATIRLTAALDALGGAQPGYDFETEDRGRKTVYPYVAEGKLVWDIPDTSRNRSQIRAEFNSNKFSFELVHIEEVANFNSVAKSVVPATPAAPVATWSDGAGNASGEGSGNPSDDGTGNEGQGKKGQSKKA